QFLKSRPEPNLLSIMPQVIFIPALRDSKDDVETSNNNSTASKILNYLFNRFLSNRKEIIEFKDAAKNVEKLFEENAKDQFVSKIENKLTNLLQRLIDIEAKLDFSPPDVTSDLAKRTQLWILDKWNIENLLSTRPEHQGHGAQRAVILSLLELLIELENRVNKEEDETNYQRPLLLLIEEPEIYLHPHMCRKMRDTLLKLSRSELCQIICTTHSPVFLDLADRHDGIAIISRNHQGKVVKKQLEEDLFNNDSESRDRLRMILNFDSSANEVFFTKKTTLVEGDCEIACVDAIGEKIAELNKIDYSSHLLTRKDVSIINCRGKLTMPAFQRVLKAFAIPYRIVHDSDDRGRDEDKAARTMNLKIKDLLDDENKLLVHHPNFEEDVFDEKWSKDKPWNARKLILNLDENKLNQTNKLETFYYFALHTTSEEMADTLEIEEFDLEDLFINENQINEIYRIPRKDHRNAINNISMTKTEFEKIRMEGIVELAAGLRRIPDLDLYNTENRSEICGRVISDSMSDTLMIGDYIRLKRLNNACLKSIDSENLGVSLDEISKIIKNGGIYAIAINEGIELGEYTLKRVHLKNVNHGEWICIISADNSETRWGERGKFFVRSSDEVHFAAEVDGLYVLEDKEEKRV
ncbi:MAG TPA: OLD family endonuclease, partial [Gimesia maris]|nr:OLD family endonuclease [Gimesia maris]